MQADFLRDRIRPMYFRYLGAAFGSALLTSIYGIVDMAMVGQYQGPDGTAALAVVMPLYNIIYSLGLLMGIGGSILFSTLRGQGEDEDHRRRSNEYFTAAAIGAVVLAAVVWVVIGLFDRQLLTAFGASQDLLPIARDYVLPVKFVVPVFLFNQMLSAFLRNDRNPALATRAVLFGGFFNVFGDYFFVFVCDMGAFGAGLATAMGSCFTFLLLLIHFRSKRNTLALVWPSHLPKKLWKITVSGFSSFFIDVAMGILTVFFNRQIMYWLGSAALSVYGVIVNISGFVQCCAYSVGQAAQPIISNNFGAGRGGRIRETLKYALATAAAFSLFWTALSLAAPNLYIRLFMTPTQEVLSIAPAIIRTYGISFLPLPLNIFSTYYFQALMRPQAAFITSVSRGCVVSGLLIFLLPLVAGADALWLAMPITELVVGIYVVNRMYTYTKQLPMEGSIAK